jgi:hypothetical protein
MPRRAPPQPVRSPSYSEEEEDSEEGEEESDDRSTEGSSGSGSSQANDSEPTSRSTAGDSENGRLAATTVSGATESLHEGDNWGGGGDGGDAVADAASAGGAADEAEEDEENYDQPTEQEIRAWLKQESKVGETPFHRELASLLAVIKQLIDSDGAQPPEEETTTATAPASPTSAAGDGDNDATVADDDDDGEAAMTSPPSNDAAASPPPETPFHRVVRRTYPSWRRVAMLLSRERQRGVEDYLANVDGHSTLATKAMIKAYRMLVYSGVANWLATFYDIASGDSDEEKVVLYISYLLTETCGAQVAETVDDTPEFTPITSPEISLPRRIPLTSLMQFLVATEDSVLSTVIESDVHIPLFERLHMRAFGCSVAERSARRAAVAARRQQQQNVRLTPGSGAMAAMAGPAWQGSPVAIPYGQPRFPPMSPLIQAAAPLPLLSTTAAAAAAATPRCPDGYMPLLDLRGQPIADRELRQQLPPAAVQGSGQPATAANRASRQAAKRPRPADSASAKPARLKARPGMKVVRGHSWRSDDQDRDPESVMGQTVNERDWNAKPAKGVIIAVLSHDDRVASHHGHRTEGDSYTRRRLTDRFGAGDTGADEALDYASDDADDAAGVFVVVRWLERHDFRLFRYSFGDEVTTPTAFHESLLLDMSTIDWAKEETIALLGTAAQLCAAREVISPALHYGVHTVACHLLVHPDPQIVLRCLALLEALARHSRSVNSLFERDVIARVLRASKHHAKLTMTETSPTRRIPNRQSDFHTWFSRMTGLPESFPATLPDGNFVPQPLRQRQTPQPQSDDANRNSWFPGDQRTNTAVQLAAAQVMAGLATTSVGMQAMADHPNGHRNIPALVEWMSSLLASDRTGLRNVAAHFIALAIHIPAVLEAFAEDAASVESRVQRLVSMLAASERSASMLTMLEDDSAQAQVSSGCAALLCWLKVSLYEAALPLLCGHPYFRTVASRQPHLPWPRHKKVIAELIAALSRPIGQIEHEISTMLRSVDSANSGADLNMGDHGPRRTTTSLPASVVAGARQALASIQDLCRACPQARELLGVALLTPDRLSTIVTLLKHPSALPSIIVGIRRCRVEGKRERLAALLALARLVAIPPFARVPLLAAQAAVQTVRPNETSSLMAELLETVRTSTEDYSVRVRALDALALLVMPCVAGLPTPSTNTGDVFRAVMTPAATPALPQAPTAHAARNDMERLATSTRSSSARDAATVANDINPFSQSVSEEVERQIAAGNVVAQAMTGTGDPFGAEVADVACSLLRSCDGIQVLMKALVQPIHNEGAKADAPTLMAGEIRVCGRVLHVFRSVALFESIRSLLRQINVKNVVFPLLKILEPYFTDPLQHKAIATAAHHLVALLEDFELSVPAQQQRYRDAAASFAATAAGNTAVSPLSDDGGGLGSTRAPSETSTVRPPRAVRSLAMNEFARRSWTGSMSDMWAADRQLTDMSLGAGSTGPNGSGQSGAGAAGGNRSFAQPGGGNGQVTAPNVQLDEALAALVAPGDDGHKLPLSRAIASSIIDHTNLRYDENSLLRLIADHLDTQGLRGASNALRMEANLPIVSPSVTPFPETAAAISTMTNGTAGGAASGGDSAPATATTLSPLHPRDSDDKGMTLHSVLLGYLRQQHSSCGAPIAFVPPVDLSRQHRCPTMWGPTTAAGSFRLSATLSTRRVGIDHSWARLLQRRESHMGWRTTRSAHYASWHAHCRHAYDARPGGDYSSPTCVAFADYGRTLIMGTSYGDLAYFDMTSEQFDDQSIQSAVLNERTFADSITVSNDSTLLGFVLSDGQVSVSKRDEVPSHVIMQEGRALAFSDDSSHVIVTPDKHVDGHGITYGPLELVTGGRVRFELHDALQRRRSLFNDQDTDEVWAATFDPTGNLVLGDAKVWDLRVSHQLPQIRFDKLTAACLSTWHPNGQHVLVDEHVWDIRTCQVVDGCTALHGTVPFFTGACGDTIYSFRRFESMAQICVIDGLDYTVRGKFTILSAISSIAVDADGGRIAAITESTTDESVVKIYRSGIESASANKGLLLDDDEEDRREQFSMGSSVSRSQSASDADGDNDIFEDEEDDENDDEEDEDDDTEDDDDDGSLSDFTDESAGSD